MPEDEAMTRILALETAHTEAKALSEMLMDPIRREGHRYAIPQARVDSFLAAVGAVEEIGKGRSHSNAGNEHGGTDEETGGVVHDSADGGEGESKD